MLARSLAVVALGVISVLTACKPAPPGGAGTYVAIGDSGTAGPIIPNPALPLGCLKSDSNFPNLAVGRLPVAELIDVSCSGATIGSATSGEMLKTGEWYPSQLRHLDARTKIVSVTIGFNDVQVAGIGAECMLKALTLTSCQSPALTARIDAAIAEVRPRLIAFYQEIHRRAPNATVFNVGTPAMLPSSGSGCFPWLPILPQDLDWMRAQLAKMDQLYRESNAVSGVVGVELPNGGVGHDVCQSAEQRWVEPPIPGSYAAPMHTNAAGHRALADALVDAVARHVPD